MNYERIKTLPLTKKTEERLLELCRRNNLKHEGIFLPHSIALARRNLLEEWMSFEYRAKHPEEYKSFVSNNIYNCVNRKGIDYLISKKLINMEATDQKVTAGARRLQILHALQQPDAISQVQALIKEQVEMAYVAGANRLELNNLPIKGIDYTGETLVLARSYIYDKGFKI